MLAPTQAPTGSGGYAFAQVHADGSPVSYDPCRPLHYVVNLQGAPPASRAMVHRAISRVQAATGLLLVNDGLTAEAANPHRRPVQPGRYGNRWVPVLIAWASARQDPELAGYIAGVGGSAAVGRSQATTHYVTGQVVLDSDEFATLADTLRGRRTAEGILLHELGHLVGLAHISDPRQLMYSETVEGVTSYAAGDLRGLAATGSGRCFPND